MKRMSCLISAAILLSCFGCSPSQTVSDVTKNETIILRKNPSQGSVYALDVTGRGKIKGTAAIILELNGAAYKTAYLTNSVRFNWSGDWYADEAKVIYQPISVDGGSLKLKYRFEAL